MRRWLLALGFVTGLVSTAHAFDWEGVAAEDTVVVITKNEDGSLRETTIWLAVLDGEGHIRTSNTVWGRNMERDPDVVLRIAGQDVPVRARRVTDPARVERLHQVFRDKYGFQDRLTGVMRWIGGGARIYQLTPRAG